MSRMIPVFLMVILLGASYSQMSWVEPEKETSGEFDDIHSVESVSYTHLTLPTNREV